VMTERLMANGGVCLVADRDLSGQGIEVDVFGARARMPGGPALLATTTGAVLLPVATWFTATGWGLQIGAPIRLADGRLRDRVSGATQALADEFAGLIAEHPSDWHMLQKFWLADGADAGQGV
jgi:lauroyl/myristoyl acyltransferase